MIAEKYRFEAHDGDIFPADIHSEEELFCFMKALWREKVRCGNLPYQFVDGQMVLRFARSLPSWIREELPASEAVAWAVMARHDKETWMIFWVIPIFVGGDFGTRYIYGEELVIDPADMRMIR